LTRIVFMLYIMVVMSYLSKKEKVKE
jgi:hypothetical protein